MKKINIFNRNIDLPSYRGTGPRKNVPSFRGNAESPRCCRELVCGKTDGIPLFSGMTVRICGMMIAIAALFATPSFAEPTELDKKTVASKAYVDTKQDIITTGNVLFYDDDNDSNDLYVPGLVAYDSSSQTLKGNKIGILDQETLSNQGFLYVYSYANGYGAEMDNFVPTVRAVANDLQYIWENMPDLWVALTWDSAETTSTNAYETKFVGDTGATTNAWPSADKNKLINTAALAQGLALKQNKLPAKSTGNAAPKGNQAVVLGNNDGYPTYVYTTAGKNLALTEKSGAQRVMNYVDGTTASATFATSQGLTEAQVKSALVSLELLKDVYSELNAKITNNALPTGTTGTVVTYNGTNPQTGVQEFGERAVYDPANAYNAQNDATKLATMASVKYVCAGYEPAAAGQPAHDGTHPGDEDYCWLWALPN